MIWTKNTTPDDLWVDYRDSVYPEGIEGIQEKECKQAFFAGIHAGTRYYTCVAESLGEDEAIEVLGTFSKLLSLTMFSENPGSHN